MSHEHLFSLVNFLALPFWVLMIVLPHWKFTRRLMESMIAPGLFAALYSALVLPKVPQVLPLFLQPPNLEATASLLGRLDATVIAWIHYLAFDLFVGRWEYLDAQQRRLSHWFLAPCLFFTLMLGPLGFVGYLICRQWGSPGQKQAQLSGQK